MYTKFINSTYLNDMFANKVQKDYKERASNDNNLIYCILFLVQLTIIYINFCSILYPSC